MRMICEKTQLNNLHWRPAGAVDAEEDGLEVLGLEGLVDERPRRLEVDLALARRVGLLGHDDAVQPDHGDTRRLLEGVAHVFPRWTVDLQSKSLNDSSSPTRQGGKGVCGSPGDVNTAHLPR